METPKISNVNYASNTYGLTASISGGRGGGGDSPISAQSLERRIPSRVLGGAAEGPLKIPTTDSERRYWQGPENKAAMAPVPTKRIVQVYIFDPDTQVPVENSMIYQDPRPRITDMSDQELFFDIDLKTRLEAHNKQRVAMINKNIKERTEHLEPARIRDLRMVVVDLTMNIK